MDNNLLNLHNSSNPTHPHSIIIGKYSGRHANVMVCTLDIRWYQVYLVGYSVDLQAHYMYTGMREHLNVAILFVLGVTERILAL